MKAKASITAVMGASGSGKSLFIKQELARTRPARLIVWDPLGEYAAHGQVMHLLSHALQAASAKSFAIVFRPVADQRQAQGQFNVLCQIAYAAGNLTFVAEELAFVTSASWAPAGWSALTLKGRHKGLRIYGASQRPASIDKNFFGNASRIRTGRLNFARDITTLADVLAVPRDQIHALKPLEWIDRDMATGKISTGNIRP